MDTTTHDETPTPTETLQPERAPVSRFAELSAMVASMEQDFHKFFNQGNKAAGTRVRQAMQELKAFAQTVRTEVLAIRNPGKPE